jgi:hypothetical protein
MVQMVQKRAKKGTFGALPLADALPIVPPVAFRRHYHQERREAACRLFR